MVTMMMIMTIFDKWNGKREREREKKINPFTNYNWRIWGRNSKCRDDTNKIFFFFQLVVIRQFLSHSFGSFSLSFSRFVRVCYITAISSRSYTRLMVILIFLHFYSSFVIDHWDCKRVNVIPSMRQLKVIIHCMRGEYRNVTWKREQQYVWDFLFCVFFTCIRNGIMIPNDIVSNTLEGKPRSWLWYFDNDNSTWKFFKSAICWDFFPFYGCKWFDWIWKKKHF